MSRPQVVTVLAGGDSPERDVSLVSGSDVYRALHEVGVPVRLLEVQDAEDLRRHLSDIEIAFSCLHGGAGEDGTIQRILENHCIPYAGSGPEASALGMDKLATKRVLTSVGVPVPQALAFIDGDLDGVAQEVIRNFSLPVVVKPQGQGASIGVKRVDTPDKLIPVFTAVLEEFGPFFVEEFIAGRELTVPILWMDGRDHVLPIVEVFITTDFFDYKTKYTDGLCSMVVPALLDSDVKARVEDAALKTHQALGCWGFSRVDILLTAEEIPYVLETNTLPGMTPHSAMPKSAAAIGIDYPHLVQQMVNSALKRPMK